MNRSVFAPLFCAFALSAALAHADVISPEETACAAHAAGDACILPAGTAGRCTARTVTVGNPAADASRTALFCVATDGGTTPADSGRTTTTPPASSSGCSVGTVHRSTAGAGALFGVAVVFAAFRRRSRRVHQD